jgi:branched-chain amino acid transport system permease protein
VHSELSLLVEGAINGSIYALIGVGFNVIYRSGRIFNLAQGELVAFAAFLTMTLMSLTWMPAWAGLILSMVAMIVLGLLTERLFLRPLIAESGFVLFTATLGLILVFRGTAILAFGNQSRSAQSFPPVLDYLPRIHTDLVLNESRIWAGIIAVAAVLLLAAFFRYSKAGLRMTAVAEDHEIARSLGISVAGSIAAAWAIVGVLSVLAAIVYAGGEALNFQIGDVAFVALPVVLLAGFESIAGVLVAGLIVGVAQEAAVFWLDPFTQGGASQMLPFVLILAILMLRPTGMFGWQRIERL